MLVAGVISGTSVDAIDVAVCEFAPGDEADTVHLKLCGFREQPFPSDLRGKLLGIFREKAAPLDEITELNFLLGEAFADAIVRTLTQLELSQEQLDLIGSHGQTLFHLVEPGRTRSTLQIAEAAVIAERTGVTVISDFRTADIAAGGQGAPLVSFFDSIFFGNSGCVRALQNIGGIGNVTFVPAHGEFEPYAFDTGPGNTLVDFAVRYLTGGREGYDANGNIGLAGSVNEALLEKLLSHPYFAQRLPKTTGRELFGDDFALGAIRQSESFDLEFADVVATLEALTGESIARAYRQFGPKRLDEVVLSGGGAHNRAIVNRIAQGLSGVPIRMHDDFGVGVAAKEAVTFALLAYEALYSRPANIPGCTGASHPSLLGKITLGRNWPRFLHAVTECKAEANGGMQNINDNDMEGVSQWRQTRSLRLIR